MSSLMGKAGRGPCQKSSRLPGRLDRKEGSAVGVRNKLSTPVTEAGGRRGGRVPDAIRYPHHHLPSDTPDKVDYERLARVTKGLEHVLRDVVR